MDQQKFHDQYIKDFVNSALNQDIELRIRLAQYFAEVSTEPFREGWKQYLKDLMETRSQIRTQIDRMEGELRMALRAQPRNDAEIARLDRNLIWAYYEVGYVARDRSVVNPGESVMPSGNQAFAVSCIARFAAAPNIQDIAQSLAAFMRAPPFLVQGVDVRDRGTYWEIAETATMSPLGVLMGYRNLSMRVFRTGDERTLRIEAILPALYVESASNAGPGAVTSPDSIFEVLKDWLKKNGDATTDCKRTAPSRL